MRVMVQGRQIHFTWYPDANGGLAVYAGLAPFWAQSIKDAKDTIRYRSYDEGLAKARAECL